MMRALTMKPFTVAIAALSALALILVGNMPEVGGVALVQAQERAAPVRIDLPPDGSATPVLTIATPRGNVAYSIAQLEALGMYRVRTATFWPGDDGVYEGPLLADVLQHAGLGDAAAVKVTAVDEFSAIMPREDWSRWPVILATRREGRPMTARSKGPLRIIYPRDMSPVLEEPVYRLRWIWLVQRIEQSGRLPAGG